MNAVVISDLHLESVHSLSHQLEVFIRSLPAGYDLILNGDIIDSGYPKLPRQNLRILEYLRQKSHNRKIVWIRGNHDNCSLLQDRGKILFKRSYTIDNRLIITHGNEIDKAKTLVQLLIRPFKVIQLIRIQAGAKPINVAQFARKVEPLYKLYRRKLMGDAVKFAKKKGFGAIACGHTHYPEDRVFQGVRYINTGAWTEYPPFYLLVNEREISLNKVDDSMECDTSFLFEAR